MKNENIVNLLLFQEENLLREFLLEVSKRNPTQETFPEISLIKYNLIRKDKFNATILAHHFLVQKLVDFAFIKFLQSENTVFSVYDFDFIPTQNIDYQIFEEIQKENFADILEILHINFLNSEFIYHNDKLKKINSKINLKETGSVYTQSSISKEIVLKTIENKVTDNTKVEDLQILDFGCGTGRFYFAALEILNKNYNIPKNQIIQNLYAIDINEIAILILKMKVLLEVGLDFLQIINQNIICKNMLIAKSSSMFNKNDNLNEHLFDFQEDFCKPLQLGGFDVIISNPPYFLLKVNKDTTNNEIYEKYYGFLTNKINAEVQYFRGANIYKYSLEGMLNYYKLSIEMILKLTKQKGEVGIICPSSLFGDISSAKLRKFILGQNKLHQLEFFAENAQLFDNISQATAIFYISKGQKTEDIKVKVAEKSFDISYDLIKNTFSENLEIPQMEEIGWDILKKLNKFQKLKTFKNLRNRRGEFDLLQFKNLITTKDTAFRLIRGNMINTVQIDYNKQFEFVEIEAFKKAKSEEFLAFDFQKVRLVCQQISNIDTSKRLKFLPTNANDILANSCNYISMNDLTSIKNLQILLNSYLLNWRFKITSTNNHINNYELDELPLIDFTQFSSVINGNELKNNVEIAKLYQLNDTEILYLLTPFFLEGEIKHYL